MYSKYFVLRKSKYVVTTGVRGSKPVVNSSTASLPAPTKKADTVGRKKKSEVVAWNVDPEDPQYDLIANDDRKIGTIISWRYESATPMDTATATVDAGASSPKTIL